MKTRVDTTDEKGHLVRARNILSDMNTRVDDEIERGELAKARNILISAIRNSPFDARLYEELGWVYLLMCDWPHAGRFLFLSGVRKPEYEGAIALFLEQYGNDWQQLVSQFPSRAARLRRDQFPETVQQYLEKLDMPRDQGEELPPISKQDSLNPILEYSCAAVIVLLCIALYLGFGIIFKGLATLLGF